MGIEDMIKIAFQWGRLFSKWGRDHCVVFWKTVNLDPYITPYTKQIIYRPEI